MADRQKQLQQQKDAMYRKRFGFTRAEILAAKGNKCAYSGSDHEGDLVIDHIKGGGRHDTEQGMIVPGLSHSMSNFRVLCRKHSGEIDRNDFLNGVGRNTKGLPNG